MTPKRIHLLAITALLSLIPAAAMADVYKWVDEDGVTHYSQQPPPAGTPTVITPSVTSPADTAADQGGEDEDANAGSENGDGNEDGEQETVAEFCKELRDREKVLQGDRPIRIKSEDGTLTDLDDEGRAQRLERVEGQLRDHCQGLEAEGG